MIDIKTIKNLFSTPKKAALSSLCALGLVAVLGCGTAYAVSSIAESSSIGAENAKNYAFADAGVDPVSAQAIRAEFDFEMGTFVYEVEFTSHGIEYEYLIKASDGSVLWRETENLKTEAAAGAQPETIGLEAAKEKALADAGVSADVFTFTKAKLDSDDGVSVYDVEFYSFDYEYEYEYEIDAETGNIRERSKEAVTHEAAGSQTGSYIGVEKAKAAALSHAGLNGNEVTFTKVKWEADDGLAVYEIEFYQGNVEYEYTVNAVDGNIVDFESDWDD